MNNAQRNLVVTLIIAVVASYGWDWTVKPQVTYSIQYPYGTPSPYYVTAGYVANGSYLQNTSPLVYRSQLIMKEAPQSHST